MKMYKIRNKETGLFSRGGSSITHLWSKEGKSWSKIGHLKNHLNQFMHLGNTVRSQHPYFNAEIVEVEVNYDDCLRYDVSVIFNDILESKTKQEELNRIRQEKWKQEHELKMLEQLKQKYEQPKGDK